MSLRKVSKFLEEYGIDRSHVAIHNWVHKANLQPISIVSEDHSRLTNLVDDADYLGAVLAEAAIDFKSFNMEIGMTSNVSFEK